ncbi:hypothetical protein [Pseudofrankia asymbiotica]|uniref:Uncharacterized protein n=1 Tax=Pseudofrankia asymbiotica TaxID=1834516 RepID=A0A1V2I9Z1_9ACTN|nr:hypothetical protein [Pseudofrankia asymbiotica]ONH28113.1 hypothetical protein BL253_20140 [Pseudofrankia asymbiotica]
MQEMDVPMPAGPGEQTRVAGTPLAAWVEQRRPFVIAGAFVLAVVLGIVIGLATASSPASDDAGGGVDVAAPARKPPLPALPWEGSRSPGTAVNMTVGDDLRPALTWATADAALAKAGKTTLSAAWEAAQTSDSSDAQSNTGAAALTADAITIPPQKLFYGAVQGASAAEDVFWAAGLTSTSSTAIPVAQLHVWKRASTGPWTEVASGAGACDKMVPKPLLTVWGPNKVCSTQG